MRPSLATASPPRGLPARTAPPAPLFAALDLGTNNCRLLIGAPSRAGIRVVESFSRVVRLGEGLAASGSLSEAAMERTLAALAACADRLQRRPVRRLAAVATEACRRAANGPAFLARAEAETGLRPRIISAREEAELAMESCSPLLTPEDRRAILFDIGGGSTEIAWVRAGARPELIGYLSLPCGVVTLAEGEDCFSPRGFAKVVETITERLAAFDRLHCIGQEIRRGGVRLIGTSGTVTTLAGVVLKLPRYNRALVDGRRIPAEAADDALAELFALGRRGLMAHPCVGPERADYVLPGCAVYAAIRRLWPVEEVTVADRGLREGMLMRLMRGETRGAAGRG
ncbi:Ppx/GppA phosphatase family protein [Rubritepida flocculans]|jgi:exopolyphosphatase/guanosine-5'-triphosphate,3'-diphosphate pyrophosphatase|uniref:Ppx/GppA phosphatase family protein n=1 Tax=Rubritepida flocculans TaxID=182403 RepID=UPI0003F62359|nr:Ppx/GppA phosphatase family protein [Rubritepida flocculans]